MPIKFNNEQTYAQQLMQAMQTEDKEQITQAWQAFHNSIVDSVKQDYEAVRDM